MALQNINVTVSALFAIAPQEPMPTKAKLIALCRQMF